MIQQPSGILKAFGNSLTESQDIVMPPITADLIKANQETGFPRSQEQDPETGGTYVKRNELNGVLNMYTKHIAYLNFGGKYTYDANLANENKYNIGTTLWSEYYKRFVVSLIDNNKNNFVIDPLKIDNINWKFAENVSYLYLDKLLINANLTQDNTEIVLCAIKNETTESNININLNIKFIINCDQVFQWGGEISIVGGSKVVGNNLTNINGIFDNYVSSMMVNFSTNMYQTSDNKYFFVTFKKINGTFAGWVPPFKLIDLKIDGKEVLLNHIGNTLPNVLTSLTYSSADLSQAKIITDIVATREWTDLNYYNKTNMNKILEDYTQFVVSTVFSENPHPNITVEFYVRGIFTTKNNNKIYFVNLRIFGSARNIVVTMQISATKFNNSTIFISPITQSFFALDLSSAGSITCNANDQLLFMTINTGNYGGGSVVFGTCFTLACA